MKKTSFWLLLLIICLTTQSYAQPGSWQLVNRIGGTDYETVLAMDVDGVGNVYYAGYFFGTVDFDPGPGVYNLSDIGFGACYVTKFDNSGNLLWGRVIAGIYDPVFVSDMTIDASGNIIMTGSFYGTFDFDPGPGVFLAAAIVSPCAFTWKLDGSGNFLWEKTIIGNMTVLTHAVNVDHSQNIYITGNFNGTVDFDPDTAVYNLTAIGNDDLLIAKYDSMGSFIRVQALKGPSATFGETRSALDDSANIYITAYFTGTIDVDPGPGTYNLTPPVLLAQLTTRLDSAGSFQWASMQGGTGSIEIKSIVVDLHGNLYSTGSFTNTIDFDPGAGLFNLSSQGGADIFITKLNNSGKLEWAKEMGGVNNDDGGTAIAQGTSGNLFVAGGFKDHADIDPGAAIYYLNSVGLTDIFLLELDSMGIMSWAAHAGGGGHDLIAAVKPDPAGNLWIAGNFASDTIFFGQTSLVNANPTGSNYDIFISRISTMATGINQPVHAESNLNVFPNPSTGHFIITSKKIKDKADLSIADISGNIVFQTTVDGMQRLDVNVENLAQGFYFIQLKTAEFCDTKKLIIAR